MYYTTLPDFSNNSIGNIQKSRLIKIQILI